MAEYYLAVDIGASSGRHILGHLENGRMELEEVYRFENGMEKKDGHLCWNIPALFREIKEGLKLSKDGIIIPFSAETKQGRDEIWALIDELTGLAATEEA